MEILIHLRLEPHRNNHSSVRWVDGVGPGRLGGRLAGGTRPGGGGGSLRRPGVRQAGPGSSLTAGDGHFTRGRGVTL